MSEAHQVSVMLPDFWGFTLDLAGGCILLGGNDGHKPCLWPSYTLLVLAMLPVPQLLGQLICVPSKMCHSRHMFPESSTPNFPAPSCRPPHSSQEVERPQGDQWQPAHVGCAIQLSLGRGWWEGARVAWPRIHMESVWLK